MYTIHCKLFLSVQYKESAMSKILMTPELEETIHEVFVNAHQWRYPTITVEQLLYQLLDDKLVKEVLPHHLRNVGVLRASLLDLIVKTSTAVPDEVHDFQPTSTSEFEMAIARAEVARKQANAERVNGIHVLVGLFVDSKWRVAQYLRGQGLMWESLNTLRFPAK